MWAHLWLQACGGGNSIGHINNGVCPQLARLADAAALRLPLRLIGSAAPGNSWRSTGAGDPRRSGRVVGNAPHAQELRLRPPAGQPPCAAAGESEEAVEAARRPEHPRHRVRPRHVQAGRLLSTTSICSTGSSTTRSPDHRRQGPLRRPARQGTDQHLRHDPRFANRSSKTKHNINVCRHRSRASTFNSRAGRWKPGNERPAVQWNFQPVDPRRVVGRRLRRLQRVATAEAGATSTGRSPIAVANT